MIRPDQLLTHSLRTHPHGDTLAEIMAAALHAVDPAHAVQRHLRLDGDAVMIGQQRYTQVRQVVVVGAGKAGAPMAQAAVAALGDRINAGVVITKHGHLGLATEQVGPVKLLQGGHPVPDASGVAAAQQLATLVDQLQADDLLLVLLSGGGSALLTLPAPGLSLADVQALTNALLRCGASISQINTLRKHCTQLGGGQLARRAAPAQVAALIISDVVGSPLDVIASGPTTPDPTTFSDAWMLVEHYNLESSLPSAIIDHLQRGMAGDVAETPLVDDPLWKRVNNQLIASNVTAAEAALAAAHQRGINASILTTFLEGEARDVGRLATAFARELVHHNRPLPRPALLIAGGETTVTLRGDGLGGRNQELALSAVEYLVGLPDTVLVALATDGGDGPTDAAGAVVTGDTLAWARAAGLDTAAFLQRNDAYHFFAALNDLLQPGPTLTNVGDLLFIATLPGASQ